MAELVYSSIIRLAKLGRRVRFMAKRELFDHPLVPLVLWGTQRLMTKDHPRDFSRGTAITIRVGPAVTVTGDDPVTETAELTASPGRRPASRKHRDWTSKNAATARLGVRREHPDLRKHASIDLSSDRFVDKAI